MARAASLASKKKDLLAALRELEIFGFGSLFEWLRNT